MNPESVDVDKRYHYSIEQFISHKKLWILTDQHGCVMLNSDDEDVVPVWPHQEWAEQWASGDWQHCEALAIDLKRWLSHWTPGLQSDQLMVVVAPVDEQEGYLLEPLEFDAALRQQSNK